MLRIQSELKSGKTIPEVCDPLGVYYTIKDGKAIFTYDQIASPKTHPIVRECRGLILYVDNFDIACYPFERFFNYGESGADILPDNLNNCLVLPKLDGTMVNLWFDRTDGQWKVATRSMMYAEGCVNNLSDKTFSILFTEAIGGINAIGLCHAMVNDYLNINYTYTWELCGPLNRIVTPYKETFATLITARNIKTGNEVSNVTLKSFAKNFECKVIEPVPMTDWKELLKMQGLAVTDEGFVVVRESKEGSHKRVKVKNPGYLALHRLVSSVSERSFMELIKRNEQDEMLVYFPEYKEYIDKLVNGLRKMEDIIKNDWLELYKIEGRKEFAIEATKRLYPSILFGMRDGKITNLSIDLLLLQTDNLLDMIRKVY